jgi:hypothetical protein
VNLLLEQDRVIALIPPDQFRLGLITEVRSSQEPLAGAARPVVDLADLGSLPGLVNEFDSGQEIIQEGAPGAVDSGESLEFGGGVKTGVADILPDAYDTSYRLRFFCSTKQ